MSVLDRLLIVVALIAALWWGLSRHRRPAVLEGLSIAAPLLAVVYAYKAHIEKSSP